MNSPQIAITDFNMGPDWFTAWGNDTGFLKMTTCPVCLYIYLHWLFRFEEAQTQDSDVILWNMTAR